MFVILIFWFLVLIITTSTADEEPKYLLSERQLLVAALLLRWLAGARSRAPVEERGVLLYFLILLALLDRLAIVGILIPVRKADVHLALGTSEIVSVV